jgi:hypothetical protein
MEKTVEKLILNHNCTIDSPFGKTKLETSQFIPAVQLIAMHTAKLFLYLLRLIVKAIDYEYEKVVCFYFKKEPGKDL